MMACVWPLVLIISKLAGPLKKAAPQNRAEPIGCAKSHLFPHTIMQIDISSSSNQQITHKPKFAHLIYQFRHGTPQSHTDPQDTYTTLVHFHCVYTRLARCLPSIVQHHHHHSAAAAAKRHENALSSGCVGKTNGRTTTTPKRNQDIKIKIAKHPIQWEYVLSMFRLFRRAQPSPLLSRAHISRVAKMLAS